jgi:RNA polymerase sigma factor (TIGR02999 family)
MTPRDEDLTSLLNKAQTGDRQAEEAVFQIVYENLRKRASALIGSGTRRSLVGTGTLVHETFEKLFRTQSKIAFASRRHFFVIATRAMKRLIIDHVRKRLALRRDGGQQIGLSENFEVRQQQVGPELDEVIAIGQICDRLALDKPVLVETLEFYYWGGLSQKEISEVVDVSETTVENRLKVAKALVARELRKGKGMGHAAGK